MINKHFLKNEVKNWLEKQIISESQANQILNLYNLSLEKEAKNFSVISILGYLFLGLSVIVMIGHNWQNIPALGRASFLIFTTLTAHIISYYRFKNSGKSNLFFLANLLYGASIILIAQAYHLGTYAPDGVFWWAIGSYMVAIFIKNPWVNLQCFILSLIWFFMELDSFYPLYFWIFLAFCFYTLYRCEQNKTLYFMFLNSLIFFIPYSLVHFLNDKSHLMSRYIEFFIFLVPFFAYLVFLGLNLDKFEKFKVYFNITKLNTNLLVNFFSFFLLSKSIFMDFQISLFEYNHLKIALTLVCVPILIASFLSKNKDLYITTAFFAGLVASFYLPFSFWIINIILFSYYCYNVYKGIANSDFSRYFIASFSLLVFAFMRYASLINDYITASIFFFVCAIVLIISAKVFKKFSGAKS